MIAFLLLLTAPSADPADRVVAAYAECLVVQAKALDDGKSDAVSVARIVREECQDEEREAAIALSGPDDYENREVVVAQIERGSLSRATRAVLRVRAGEAR